MSVKADQIKQGNVKTLSMIVLLALLALTALLVKDYQEFISVLDHKVSDRAIHVHFETERFFQQYRLLFEGIAETSCLKLRTAEHCDDLLKRLNTRFPNIENFAATDRNGLFFASGMPFDRENPPNIRDLDFFRAVQQGADVAVMEVHTGPISGVPVTGMVIALRDAEGAFDGGLGASINLQEIEQIWGSLLTDVAERLFVFDGSGLLLARSDGAEQMIDSGRIDPALLFKAAQQATGPGMAEGITVFQREIEPAGWLVLALRSEEATLAGHIRNRPINYILGAGLVLLLGSLLFVANREANAKEQLLQARQKLQHSRRELDALSALEQSELRYRELFQKAPVGLWEEDFGEALDDTRALLAQGIDDLVGYFDEHPDRLRAIAAKVRVINVNAAALKLHKASSREELLGSLQKLFNDNSYHMFAREIAALAKGESYLELQGEVVTLDGEIRLVIGRIYRLTDNDSRQRMLVATSDVTELRNMEATLRHSQKMEAIGKISGGIAHDFNNILGIILGNLDLLQMKLDPGDSALKRVETAQKAALRASELTRQLLGFSRRQEQDTKPTDLNDAVTEIKSLIERSLTPAIEVHYRLQQGLWLTSVNVGDFKDALLNLIINARDSIPESGSIELEIDNYELKTEHAVFNGELAPGDYVRLRISDTGSGIPVDVIDKVFDPFFTTKPVGKGTGLGLSMVFGFVKRSAGGIRVDSTPGQGTTISICLPRKRTMTPIPPSQSAASAPGVQHREKKVLIVDDEEDLLELASEQLQSLGFNVVTASNGKEALQRLKEITDINLLFTDIVMPGGLGGYELAERALKLQPGLKVLFTSGYAREMQQSLFVQTQTHLLNKPYSREQLEQILQQVL